MADKTLKLKATFDVAEVGKGADKAVKEINRVAAAGEAAAVKLNAAQGKSYLAAQGHIAGLFGQIRGLGGLDRALGLPLEAWINGVRTLPAVIASVGTASLAAGAGIAAALIPIGAAIYKLTEIRRLRAELADSLSGNNEKTLGKLYQTSTDSVKAGGLRGGEGQDMAAEALNLYRQQKVVDKMPLSVRLILSEGIEKQTADLLRRMAAVRRESYDTEDAGAREHARNLTAIDEVRSEEEKKNLKAKLDLGLISQQQYADKLRGILTHETAGKLALLDLEEKQVAAKLERLKNDPEEAAKLRNRIVGIGGERALLQERKYSAQDDISRETEAALRRVTKFTLAPTGADELSKLGLFRGGAGDNFPSLQLNELKVISRKLDDHSVILRTR